VVLIARPAALTLPASELETETAAVRDRLSGSDRGHRPANP
jgi:hypothetical protein